MRKRLLRPITTFLLFTLPFAPGLAGQEEYDVVWETPGEDASDSMPLGNGDITLNAWVEGNGDLVFYIGKTDSWGDNGRLLKVGKIRVSLEPCPLVDGFAFSQRLDLGAGTMEVRLQDVVVVRLWVDANHPVVHVTATGPDRMTMTASIELWRTERYELPSIEVSDIYLHRSHPDGQYAPTIVEPDTLLNGLGDRIGWYHHNTKSVGPELTARIQGLSAYQRVDPLLHRTFGVIVSGPGAERVDETHLRSARGRSVRLDAYVQTEHPAPPEEWLKRVERTIVGVESRSFEERRAAHDRWWSEFWERSWIHVTSSSAGAPPIFVPENDHPVRVGWDQSGQNRFVGEIGRVSILCLPLDGEAIAALARTPLERYPGPADETVLFRGRAVGDELPVIDGSSRWDFRQGFTIEAWLKPGDLPGGGGRIVDKITPGGSDGFLFDTHPGRSLRLITAVGTLTRQDVLPEDSWSHVAAVVDPIAGELSLYLDGELLARESIETLDDAFAVSRGYTLQRFLDACAGRGAYPIKFNGSIFTVPNPGSPGDADYRRWGPGYWWQNTRLPYLSMCTSGDFEMLQPLFDMYAGEVLKLSTYRTKHYFDHGGAYYPECIYFWGDVFSESYGWTPFEEREDKLQESGWHKWEWVCGPELVWMMLDRYDHTLDETFLKEEVLPAAHEVLTFFDQHHSVDENGKLVMYPAQAVETWWDCTNPMPEVAGLHAVTARLSALPEKLTSGEERAFWISLRDKLPDLPLREVDGQRMLAPAERFEQKRNIENPELYAVFPFRLVSFEKENAELGLRAFEHRWDRGNFGWRQEELFLAYLGQGDEARRNLVGRAKNSHAGSRFPAFWGPNYDWVPDQDHGGVLMRALQVMLLQSEGDSIFLLPAWPRDWDVSFKLHAPQRTVVECEYRGGEIRSLKVTPEHRAADVVARMGKD